MYAIGGQAVGFLQGACKAAVEKGVGAKYAPPSLASSAVDQFALPDCLEGTVERERLCCHRWATYSLGDKSSGIALLRRSWLWID